MLYSQHLTSYWAACSCKQDRKERYWGQQFGKWKGHFGPTDRNDQTDHSGPPSKLVPNIPGRANQNGPFHLINQAKFPDSWVEWKAPPIFKKNR